MESGIEKEKRTFQKWHQIQCLTLWSSEKVWLWRIELFEKNKKNIGRLVNRFDIEYDILATGYTNDKEEASKSLPMLNKVVAFPTMIVIDKKGVVREIHTGFSGPGTGKYYVNFVNQFENMMNKLLAE